MNLRKKLDINDEYFGLELPEYTVFIRTEVREILVFEEEDAEDEAEEEASRLDLSREH